MARTVIVATLGTNSKISESVTRQKRLLKEAQDLVAERKERLDRFTEKLAAETEMRETISAMAGHPIVVKLGKENKLLGYVPSEGDKKNQYVVVSEDEDDDEETEEESEDED